MTQILQGNQVDEAAIEALAATFRGELVGPSHPSYEEARKVWNGSIDRRPALVARCTGVADVRAALAFARERDLPIAVRGGGHNVAGFGTCDDGIVLDLSPMKFVRLDRGSHLATAGPGLLWGELDRETQAFGLAATGGVMSTTGVAGFTLGGGIGWLQRKHGLACDLMVGADVVTADGDLVRAAPDENSDLLWGLRGGGGNFGVVTAFDLEMRPVGPQVFSGLCAWPGDKATEVLRFYRDLMLDAPDEMMIIAICRTAPPAPFLPESLHGKPIIALAGMYEGSVEEGEKAFAPVRAFSSPDGDAYGPKPYTGFNAMFDGSWAPGFRNYWKAEFLREFPDACIDTVAHFAVEHTSPLSDFKFPALGGAVSRVGEHETAYGHRSAAFQLVMNTRWSEPGEDQLHTEHTQRIWESVQPWADGGAYVNFMGNEGADRVRQAYGDEKFAKLQGLKKRFDPDNVFHLNQNIPPA